MTKRILIIVFSLLVIGAFAFTVTWGVINFNKVQEGMSGTGLYTKEDINNAYDDGYGDGVKDKAEYTILIAEYRSTIMSLQDTVTQLRAEVNKLQPEAAKVKQLNRQIDILQENIEFYENYISSVETEDKAVVTFVYADLIYDIEIVDKGTTAAIANPPAREDMVFYGWTVDGVAIDLNTYTFNHNTRVIAEFKNIYTVRFATHWKSTADTNWENVFEYSSVHVLEGGIAIAPADIWVTQQDDFVGWSTVFADKNTMIDLTTTPITENCDFYPYLSGFENNTGNLPTGDADPGKLLSLRRAA